MSQTQTKQLREYKEFKVMYDWLKIARKPHNTLSEDLQLLMSLINIPISKNQLQFFKKTMDLTSSSDTPSQKLSEQAFFNYFVISQDKKKIREKQIVKAFKYVSQNQDSMRIEEIQECLKEDGLDLKDIEVVLKQIADFQDGKGNFQFKKFAAAQLER